MVRPLFLRNHLAGRSRSSLSKWIFLFYLSFLFGRITLVDIFFSVVIRMMTPEANV